MNNDRDQAVLMSNRTIDPGSLQAMLDASSRIGATANGGLRRLTLTPGDKAARDLLAGWARDGGYALAVGIWAMHFVGMLAARLPCPVDYLVFPTLLSFLVCVIVVGAGVFAAVAGPLTPIRLTAGAHSRQISHLTSITPLHRRRLVTRGERRQRGGKR